MNRFCRWISACAILTVVATAAPSVGGTIVMDDVIFPITGAPQTAALDIWFQTADPATPIAAFQLELSLLGPDDAVKITDVAAPQTHPYVFDGSSSGPLFLIEPDGSQVLLGDFLDTGFAQLADGVGLASIQLLIEPEAVGKTYQLRISTDPSVSFLAVDTSTFIEFDVRDGSISQVPEPSSVCLCLSAMLGACVHMLARRRSRGLARVRLK